MIPGLASFSRRLGARTIANLPFPLRKRLVAPFIERLMNSPPGRTAGELPTLSLAVLLHPRLDTMAAALAANSALVVTLPSASVPPPLERQVEKLAGLLGGRVRSCGGGGGGGGGATVAEAVAETAPAMIIGPLDGTVRALDAIRKREPARWDSVRDALQFLVNIDPRGPLSGSRAIAIERAFDADVVDVFTDAFSFAFVSCPCGATHPPPHYHLEVVDEEGKHTAGPGRMLVTDRARRVPRVDRYATPFRVTVSSSPCAFFGQAAAVACHGRQGELLHTPAGPVGLLELEGQLFTHGLFTSYSVRPQQDRWHVAVEPFADGEVDVGAVEKALCTRFELPVKVAVAASLWGPAIS